MSDNTETQPTKEETPTAAAAETTAVAETTAEAEVSEAVAPVAEPESTTPEEPKPSSETEGASAEPATEEDKPAEEPSAEETTPAATEAATEEAEEEVKEPEPIEIPSGNGELVLVTGATGYLASHIVKQLHESGEFKVRGTVRSLEENAKLDSLKALLKKEDEECTVEFVEADLTKPESWTEAVKGCEYVIHTASPFPIVNPTDENEVIDPAREGTLAVLKACVEAKSIKRVVITSSIVAVYGGRTLDKNAMTEDMWADTDKQTSAYDKSKAIAEKAAWDFIKELPEDSPLELSVVNPGFIFGPPLMNMDCTSIEVIKKLMNREYSTLPKISFACSDVRDVALAHLRAMMIKQAAGERHIVTGASAWLKDMANMMSQEFSSKGFNIPTTQVPYVLVWLKSHFNQELKRILPEVGKIYNFDTSRMRNILQVEPRDVKTSLIEMGHAMINLDIVHKVEKVEKKPRKLTFRKKKEKKVDEEEEKKDEPEKAASTSGSADAGSVPDATIEDVEIKVLDAGEEGKPAEEGKPSEEEVKPAPEEEKPAAEAEEETTPEVVEAETKAEAAPAAEESKVESAGEESGEAAAVHSEEEVKDEATTSDPESTKKKDKKAKKEKKEKGEKKKGGLFSFSFKKNKKPHVEKKSEGDKSDEADEAPEEAVATEETPAATTEEAPAVTAEEAPAVTAEETPATAAEEAPASEEKTPADNEETPAAEAETEEVKTEEAKTEEAPAKPEETPVEDAKVEETPAEPTVEEPAAADVTAKSSDEQTPAAEPAAAAE